MLFPAFNRSLDFAAGFAGLDGFAAVVEFLALGKPELYLGMTALGEVDAERHEGEALLLRLAHQLVDFFLVQEQFSGSGWIMIHDVAMAVGTDMTIVEKDFAVAGCGVAVLQIRPPVAQRFYFGALQHDSGFELFFDKIVVERFAVRHHDLLRLVFVFRHVAAMVRRP